MQKLIDLWIAQDFVKPRNQSQACLEDVGYEYFMDLLWRSFFQEAKADELGPIKTCKMQTLILSGCTKFVRLPRGIKKPINLRRELSKFNHLQGHLAIMLGCGKEVASESKAAQFEANKHIESLYLDWYSVEADDDVDDIAENVERTLDGLQPPQRLEALEVQNYMGMRFSTWLSSLTNLVLLRLEYCRSCQHLPPLRYLLSLKELLLRDLPSLEYVNDDQVSTSYLSASTMPFFPSLEKLSIINCHNLKGWWQIKRGNVGEKDDVLG